MRQRRERLDLDGAPPWAEVSRKVRTIVEARGGAVLAWNATFDAQWLPQSWPWVCAMRRFAAREGRERFGLAKALALVRERDPEALGDVQNTHRAMGDAQAAAALWRWMVAHP
jgi:hypothetical protein